MTGSGAVLRGPNAPSVSFADSSPASGGASWRSDPPPRSGGGGSRRRRETEGAFGACRLLLASGAAALALGGVAHAEPAPAPKTAPIVTAQPPFVDDDLLLFAVFAGGVQLSDSFEAYSSRSGVYLPLGALARLLDVDVDVDPQRGRAQGTVGAPARRIRLDAPARSLMIDEATSALGDADVALRDGDLWVRADLVEKILPLKITADISGLNLQLAPTQPLPFQARLQREMLRRQLAGAGAVPEAPPLDVATPYRLFTPPTVDLNLNAGVGNDEPKRTGSFDLRAAGDLAGAGAQLFAGSDGNFRLDSVRMLLSRKDPAGRMAGPFGATRSTLGDTFSPTLALGARSVAGRGFTLTSEPLERASVFDHMDLRGELPLGFQVELYVNEVLRGAQTQPIQGRYEFLNVPLVYGLNVVRLVFYGPRGERREDVRRINVGAGQLGKGQTTFAFGAVQEGRNLVEVGRSQEDAAAATPGFGRWRIAGEVAHGLTESTTLTASFAQYTPRLDDTRRMGAVGLEGSFMGAGVQLDVAADSQGGRAVAGGVAARAGATSIVLRHAEYAGGFIDETQPAGAGVVPLRRHTDLAVDTVLKLLGDEAPASFHVDWDGLEDGEQALHAAARISKAISRYLVSSGFIYDHRSGAGAGGDVLNGLLDVSGVAGETWQLRAEALYGLGPRLALQSATVTADRNLGERAALHLGLSHTFATDETTLEAGQTWRTRPADISLVASYDVRKRDVRVGIQLSVGFGYDPTRGRYAALGANAAAGGAMAVDAFLDANGNGVRDPAEKPLPGLVVQGGRRAETTGADGRALITGLGDGAHAEAVIDMSSLDDPYLLPAAPAVRIVPRPGRVAVVAYPVTVSGEVELHAEFQRPGEAAHAISALHLELVDASGQVAAAGSSEFDGALVLDTLKPGTYAVRLEPAQAARLKLALVEATAVTIKPSGGFAGRVRVLITTKTAAGGEEGAR